jgi:hypothetical protein
MTALALVTPYPSDVTTLVAHEPPLIPVLPAAQAAVPGQAPPSSCAAWSS